MNLPALSLIPTPYKVLAAVLTAAALWGHGYITGGDHANDKRAAADLRAVTRADLIRRDTAAKVNTVAGKFEKSRTIRADEAERLTVIAQTLGPSGGGGACRIDDERVRLINRAFETRPDPGEPDGEVRPHDGTAGRESRGVDPLGDSQRGTSQ